MVGVLGMNLRSYIRDIADFPTPGILFRDITPLLSDASALKYAVDRMLELCEPLSFDVIVSVEARVSCWRRRWRIAWVSRWFPCASRVSCRIRRTESVISSNMARIRWRYTADGIGAGQRALIVDDLLATGGTVGATAELIRECGAQVAGYAFLIELAELNGRQRLSGEEVVSLITYD